MNREDYLIRDQSHLMDAEGCQTNEPEKPIIVTELLTRGFSSSNIKIAYDDFTESWRWSCDISRVD